MIGNKQGSSCVQVRHGDMQAGPLSTADLRSFHFFLLMHFYACLAIVDFYSLHARLQ